MTTIARFFLLDSEGNIIETFYKDYQRADVLEYEVADDAYFVALDYINEHPGLSFETVDYEYEYETI